MMRRVGWMLIGLLVAVLAHSQGVPPAMVEFEFSVMATERLRDVAYVQLKEEARHKTRLTVADFDVLPLGRVNSQGRSDRYRYSGPLPLRFVRTQGSGEALAVERVLATVNQPASRGRSLFLLIAADEEPWQVVSLDDEVTALPRRHVRMVNLAGEPLAVSVDGQSLQLTANPVPTAPRTISGNLKLGVAMERHGRAIPVFDQSLSVSDDERLLIVFLPPFRAGADVRTRIVRDTLAPPPEPGGGE